MREDQVKRLLAVEAVMLEHSSRALAYFVESNPHMRGAKWADALDTLCESDAHCDITDLAYEDVKPHVHIDSLHYIVPVTLTLMYSNKGHAPFSQDIAYYCGRIAGWEERKALKID